MKKIYAILIALLILVSPVTALAAKYEPPAEVYVADYANVIDSDVENYIVKNGAALCEKTGAQIVIMTVNFIDGDFEDFCYEIFNDWGIGDAKLNNGILVVMSIGDQDAYCLQGAGLERSLTSGTITTMMVDYLYDDFMAGDYSIGAKHIFDAFKDWLCDYYDVTLTGSTSTGTNQNHGTTTTYPEPEGNGGNDVFATIVGFIVFMVILILLIRLIFRPRYRYNSNRYYNRYGRYGSGYNSYNSYNNSHPSNHSSWGSSGHSHSSGSSWGSSGHTSSHSSGSSWGSSGSSSHSSGHSSSSHISHSSSSHSSGGSHSSGSFGGGGSRGGGGGFGKH